MHDSDATTFETIKRRVEARIDEVSTNMKAVSLKAGLGETFVRDMLKRGRAPGPDALAKIAAALDTSVAWLTGETSNGEAPFAPKAAPIVSGLVTIPEYDVRLSAGPGMLI